MNNKTYDILKYIALIVLPATATLVLTLSGIWNYPYGEAIAGTITALDAFLGALLGVSSAIYNAPILNIGEEVKEDEKGEVTEV